jgi:hypothetical protein
MNTRKRTSRRTHLLNSATAAAVINIERSLLFEMAALAAGDGLFGHDQFPFSLGSFGNSFGVHSRTHMQSNFFLRALLPDTTPTACLAAW